MTILAMTAPGEQLKMPASITERWRGAILPAVVIVLLVALMLRLGYWQLQRAHEKEALLAAFAAGDATVESVETSSVLADMPRYRKVSLAGRLLKGPVILLENRFLNERPGFDLMLLFRPERGPLVLLNQGWVAQPPEKLSVPDGALTVVGRVDVYPRPGMQLGEAFAGVSPASPVWSSPYVDAASLEERLGAVVSPRVLLMDAPLVEGPEPHWQPATMPPEKHYGYAFQWFSMAGVLAGIGIWLALRRRKA